MDMWVSNMTQEQVEHLLISIDTQFTRFIPRDFINTIRKTREYQWAISDIIRSACFYITGEHPGDIHEFDELIKSELERISL